MLLRIPFRLPCVRQIVEPLRANGWAANHRVLETISLREGGIKQSRVVENGFFEEPSSLLQKKYGDGRIQCVHVSGSK